MGAYGYGYESSAAASGYLSGGRGPPGFGNPGSYGMPGSAFASPYGSSTQGSAQGLSGVTASIPSGVSPVSHHGSMQTSSSAFSTAPPHLGSGSGSFPGFSSAYGPTGPSSYGSLMSSYQNCSALGDTVLHQGESTLFKLLFDYKLLYWPAIFKKS